MKRALLLLHLAVMAASVVACCLVCTTTAEHGGALWTYWRARREMDRAMMAAFEKAKGEDQERLVKMHEGRLAELGPLLAKARAWGLWRDRAWWASVGVLASSLALLLVCRSRMAAASFALCLQLAFVAHGMWGVLF